MSEIDPPAEDRRRPPDDEPELGRDRAPRPGVRRRRPRKRAFEVGKVFGKSLSIWARNVFPLTLLALIVFAPFGAWLYWIDQTDEDAIPAWSGYGEVLLQSLLTALLAAPVVGMVIAQLRGRPLSLGAALGPGLARLVPAFGAAFLVALIDLAFDRLGEAIGQPLGTWVVLVPRTVAWCGLFVAVPAAVAERPGVFGALARSWRLTDGHKAQIFLIVLLFGILIGVGASVIAGLTFAASGSDFDDGATGFWLAMYLMVAVVSSMSAVFSGVIYHDLRVAVEGVDTEEIAAVFD